MSETAMTGIIPAFPIPNDHAVLSRRVEIVVLIECRDSNPNGDPDAGNMPRMDAVSGEGLMSDACIKRKIRNYVAVTRAEQPGHAIFITDGAVLNRRIEAAFVENKDLGATVKEFRAMNKKAAKVSKEIEAVAAKWLAGNYFDIRAFGGVLSTGDGDTNVLGDDDQTPAADTKKFRLTAGQVTGPVQVSFARSVGKIQPIEVAVTRMAVTNEKDLEKERTFGRKFVVPYGLYKATITLSPALAARTGFANADLHLLLEALHRMFEFDRSAARPMVLTRGVWAFVHESAYGNAPAHELIDRIAVTAKVEFPQSFGDINLSVSTDGLRRGVTMVEVPYDAECDGGVAVHHDLARTSSGGENAGRFAQGRDL
jgi:CRISPR-associated protein Csd2